MDNIGLKKGDLMLLDYDNNYTEIYNHEKRELEEIFKGKYVKIEHVGSTSIKNIKSKPIIDILIVCKDMREFIDYTREKVSGAIYTIKEEPTKANDFLIRKEENGKVKAFIHVLPKNSVEAENYIVFRDYLNNNIEEAKKYENLKVELYNKFRNDRKSYTEGKESYIKGIIERAKKEEYR